MAISLALRFAMEPQRSITAATIAGSPGTYLGIGISFTHSSRQFYILNATDVSLQFSIDGINDHFVLVANGYFLNDVSSNKSEKEGLYVSQGTRFYVKTLGTPTTGAVYLSMVYGASQ